MDNLKHILKSKGRQYHTSTGVKNTMLTWVVPSKKTWDVKVIRMSTKGHVAFKHLHISTIDLRMFNFLCFVGRHQRHSLGLRNI